MSSAAEDRGLRAVARVREVRERDSRLGLQRALEEQRVLEARMAGLQRRLADGCTGADEVQDVSGFLAQRAALQAIGDAARDVGERLASATLLRAAADAHWQADKTRLSAVEGLLENRAEIRRAEQEHEAAKELDDAAGRLWLRRARGGRS